MYAYVRSKQNVRETFAPPEDSAGNIISQRCFNGGRPKRVLQFSDDISSLPFPDASFQEIKSDHLGQVFVNQEIVAKTIKAMNDNKSPGVDRIQPKLPMETLEQIPLARVFNLSLRGSGSF